MLQENAEQAVRGMLQQFSRDAGLPEVGTVSAEDSMDDGTPICLSITVDRRDGSAVFDFAGALTTVELNSGPTVGRLSCADKLAHDLLAQVDDHICCSAFIIHWACDGGPRVYHQGKSIRYSYSSSLAITPISTDGFEG